MHTILKVYSFTSTQCVHILQYMAFFFNPQLLEPSILQGNLNLTQVCRLNNCKGKACENVDRLFHTDSEIGSYTNFLSNCRIFLENGCKQPELLNRGWQIHLPAANWRLPGKRRHNSPDLVRI